MTHTLSLALVLLTAPPAGLVRLADVAPEVVQDLRYRGADNLLGRPVAGYEAVDECHLTPEAARALKRAQKSLRKDGLGLKVYDCWRPPAASKDFVAWTEAEPKATGPYNPRVARGRLVAEGYIAARSEHSLGTTVDLTLVPLVPPPAPASAPAPAPDGDCSAPAGKRPSDGSLEMGTAYDCLDERSWAGHPFIWGEAAKNRARLVKAMRGAGFRPYHREWWHFTWRGPPSGSSAPSPKNP